MKCQSALHFEHLGSTLAKNFWLKALWRQRKLVTTARICAARSAAKIFWKANTLSSLHFEHFESTLKKNGSKRWRTSRDNGSEVMQPNLVLQKGLSPELFRRTQISKGYFLLTPGSWVLGFTDAKAKLSKCWVSTPCDLVWHGDFFSDAKDLFEDHTLDFVYFDGFASDGELEGQTFEEFNPKVRAGGVFGGHDYDKQFPLVKEEVQRFFKKYGLKIHVIPGTGTAWDCCNSWFVVVPWASTYSSLRYT